MTPGTAPGHRSTARGHRSTVPDRPGTADATVAAPPTRRRDFPGWHMVAVLAVTETIGYGALFYCFAVMVVPMRESLGATTGQLSGAMSLALAVGGAAAVPVGRWVDRHGARGLMTAGSLLGAASVLAWSRAGTPAELYAAFVGVGLAGAAVLYEPAFAVVTTWFRRDRARALLALTVVAGFSSTVFVPLSQSLVDAVGWRDALVVLAGLLAACAPAHAVVLRRSPADLGLSPDGGTAAASCPDPGPGPGSERSDARGVAWRRSPAVRRLTVAAVLQAVAITAVAVHLVAYLRDTGTAPAVAAGAAGALGVLSVAGRVAVTALASRVGLARLAAAVVAGQAGGVVALLTAPRPAGVVVFVVLFGAGSGVMTIARAALLGSLVPTGVFASVSGAQAMAATGGRLAAPVSVGAVISTVGYGPAFVAVAVCSVAAALALAGVERAGITPPSPPAPARWRRT